MIAGKRYVVEWRSSLTGRHTDAYLHESAARRRLDEVEQRDDFVRGAVVDNATGTDQQHAERHRAFTEEVFGRA